MLATAAAALALASTSANLAQGGTEPPLPPPSQAPSPGEIVAAAAPDDWVKIAADDLIVMTLAPDRDGNSREVVIQLMPAPFSQGWVSNIRKLARAKWYDGVSVNRVQDNYVVQWGDPGHDNPESGEVETKPLPEGLKVMEEDEYTVDHDALADAQMEMSDSDDLRRSMGSAGFLWVADSALEAVLSRPDLSESQRLEAIQEYLEMTDGVTVYDTMSSEEIAMISIETTTTDTASQGWHQRDSYAAFVEFWKGWPIGNYEADIQWYDDNDKKVPDPKLSREEASKLGYFKDVGTSRFWPVHCYGMVGVGRNYSPDTGSGAELYTVIGHAPRHLDRNIALVGRIVSGIEHLSSLPRGSGALGFYTEEEADKRTPILSVRVASDLPASETASSSEAVGQPKRPTFEYLSTESETFARYAEARANRRDPFFIVPAGGADICNIPVPIREVTDE
ncbi:MAG: peptidylprolyl isomerase [Pseudomonadota bacterium]